MISTPHCFFKAVPLKMVPTVGPVGRMYIPRMGRRWGVFDSLGPACNSTSCHLHSMTSSNMVREFRFYDNLKKRYKFAPPVKLYLILPSPILPTLCSSLLLFCEHTFSWARKVTYGVPSFWEVSSFFFHRFDLFIYSVIITLNLYITFL